MSKKKKIDFTECPCCGKVKYALLQDKVHLDWARTCVACGYQIELMPRASSRISSFNVSRFDDKSDQEFEALKAGLQIGDSIEELFADLSVS